MIKEKRTTGGEKMKGSLTKNLVVLGLCAWFFSFSDSTLANEQINIATEIEAPIQTEAQEASQGDEVSSPLFNDEQSESINDAKLEAIIPEQDKNEKITQEIQSELDLEVHQQEEAQSEVESSTLQEGINDQQHEELEDEIFQEILEDTKVDEKTLSDAVKESEQKKNIPEVKNTQNIKPVSSVTKDTRYFTVKDGQIPVYNNGPNSENILVGYVLPNREYKIRRLTDDLQWAVVNFGDKNAYIRTSQIIASTGTNFKNPVQTTKRTGGFLTNSKAAVYEQSSNRSTIYAYLQEDVTYSVLGNYYNFYLIDIGGRTVYLHADNLKKDPKIYSHFIPKNNIAVYHQSETGDIRVGTLLAKQEYQINRFSDGTKWIVTDFGHKNAYVRTSNVTLTNGANFKNAVKIKSGTSQVTINSKAAVYKTGDNQTSNIYSYLEPNVTYQMLGEYYNYYLVNIGGRYGYVHKDNTGPIVAPKKENSVPTNQTNTEEPKQDESQTVISNRDILSLIGLSENDIKQIYGAPTRIDSSRYGYNWWIYPQMNGSYIQVGLKNGKVVTAYGMGSTLQPFYSGQDQTSIFEKYPVKEQIKVVDSGTEYVFQLTTDELKTNPLIPLNDGKYAIFYMDGFTETLAGVRLLDLDTLLVLRPYSYLKYLGELKARPSLNEQEKIEVNRADEKQVFDLTNIIRNQHNKGSLTWNEKVANVARGHSADMQTNNYFEHESPTKGDLGARLDAGKVEYSIAGENIAYNYADAVAAMNGWLNSKEHRIALLEPEYEELGVGVKDEYYTQNFITNY